MRPDIGGTPARILESNKINNLEKSEQEFIAILDPFDLSRDQRKLVLGDYKTPSIKFPINETNVNLNSELVKPPSSKEIITLMEQAENSVIGKIQNNYKLNINEIKNRYNQLKINLAKLAEESLNLREFMNGIITLLSPKINLIKIEEVLSKNKNLIYEILEKTDIPVRAVCPKCNCFIRMNLKEKTPCCSISSEEIINSGKYLPQEGFLAVITYFCGYLTYDSGNEKAEQAKIILNKIGKTGNPILSYRQKEKLTMFESYLLGDLNNSQNKIDRRIKWKNLI